MSTRDTIRPHVVRHRGCRQPDSVELAVSVVEFNQFRRKEISMFGTYGFSDVTALYSASENGTIVENRVD